MRINCNSNFRKISEMIKNHASLETERTSNDIIKQWNLKDHILELKKINDRKFKLQYSEKIIQKCKEDFEQIVRKYGKDIIINWNDNVANLVFPKIQDKYDLLTLANLNEITPRVYEDIPEDILQKLSNFEIIANDKEFEFHQIECFGGYFTIDEEKFKAFKFKNSKDLRTLYEQESYNEF